LHQCTSSKDGDGDAGVGRSLQAADTVADASDAPFKSRRLEPFQGMVAIDVAWGQQRQRDRRLLVSGRMLARHPDKLFLADDLPTGEIVHAGNERNVDFASFETPDSRRR